VKELIRFRRFLNESNQPDLLRYEIDYYGKEGTPLFRKRARIKTVVKAEDPERKEKAEAIALQHFRDNYDVNSFYSKPTSRTYWIQTLGRPEWEALEGKTTSKISGNLNLDFVEDVIKNLGYGDSENESGNRKSDINPNQTIFNIQYKNKKNIVNLYITADNFELAKQIADQYMSKEYENSFRYNKRGSRQLSEPFGGLEPEEQEQFKGKIADFGFD